VRVPWLLSTMAGICLNLHRPREAARWAREVLALDPDDAMGGRMLETALATAP
jgi:hypothetical protein